MSKKSIIARNTKRQRMITHYADLRKQLKAEGKWEVILRR